jgi:FlaA1/EpsC-like NDP-sugar epimerase
MTMRGSGAGFIQCKRKSLANPRAKAIQGSLVMNVLVVGGAGYIGSHCVRQLLAAGHRPVVLDNLVYGHRGRPGPAIPLHEGDLGDEAFVGRVLREERIELVMHFAAFCYVGESVTSRSSTTSTTSSPRCTSSTRCWRTA